MGYAFSNVQLGNSPVDLLALCLTQSSRGQPSWQKELSSLVLYLCQMIMEEKSQRFLLISSKHLGKRTRMLTHWKDALENMDGLELLYWETKGILPILGN